MKASQIKALDKFTRLDELDEPNSAMFLGIIHDGRFYVNYQEYGNAEVAVASLSSFNYLM